MTIYYLSIVGLNSKLIATVFQNEARGIVWDMFACQYVWVVLCIIPLVALVPDFCFICFSQVLSPGLVTKCRNYLYNQPYIEEEEEEEQVKAEGKLNS